MHSPQVIIAVFFKSGDVAISGEIIDFFTPNNSDFDAPELYEVSDN
ncbi:TPA: hypothetical protein ACGTRQ_001935 [Vibrio parahaemolyticus]